MHCPELECEPQAFPVRLLTILHSGVGSGSRGPSLHTLAPQDGTEAAGEMWMGEGCGQIPSAKDSALLGWEVLLRAPGPCGECKAMPLGKAASSSQD